MTGVPQAAIQPCIQNGRFATALNRLWPHGDSAVPGPRAGMIAAAPVVFPKYGISIRGLRIGCGSPMSRSLSSGARSRGPLAHPGYVTSPKRIGRLACQKHRGSLR